MLHLSRVTYTFLLKSAHFRNRGSMDMTNTTFLLFLQNSALCWTVRFVVLRGPHTLHIHIRVTTCLTRTVKHLSLHRDALHVTCTLTVIVRTTIGGRLVRETIPTRRLFDVHGKVFSRNIGQRTPHAGHSVVLQSGSQDMSSI